MSYPKPFEFGQLPVTGEVLGERRALANGTSLQGKQGEDVCLMKETKEVQPLLKLAGLRRQRSCGPAKVDLHK